MCGCGRTLMAWSGGQGCRTHLIEEDERPEHAFLAHRQDPAYREAAEVMLARPYGQVHGFAARRLATNRSFSWLPTHGRVPLPLSCFLGGLSAVFLDFYARRPWLDQSAEIAVTGPSFLRLAMIGFPDRCRLVQPCTLPDRIVWPPPRGCGDSTAEILYIVENYNTTLLKRRRHSCQGVEPCTVVSSHPCFAAMAFAN